MRSLLGGGAAQPAVQEGANWDATDDSDSEEQHDGASQPVVHDESQQVRMAKNGYAYTKKAFFAYYQYSPERAELEWREAQVANDASPQADWILQEIYDW